MKLFSRSSFHESIACAALLATSIALHVSWICNLLIARSDWMRSIFTLSETIGPVSGLYLKTASSFVVVFLAAGYWWKGKDCSHLRSTLLRFFYVSILIFLCMTLPIVYQFSVLVE